MLAVPRATPEAYSTWPSFLRRAELAVSKSCQLAGGVEILALSNLSWL